jgi:hypothetical protein
MTATAVGYVIGGFFFSLLVPVLILIVCHFIPAANRNPKVVYGICGLVAIVPALLIVGVDHSAWLSVVSAMLALAFIFWGYTRAAKKKLTPPANPST